jgi:hypothetical protein
VLGSFGTAAPVGAAGSMGRVFTKRTIIGTPLMAATTMVWLWRRVRPGRTPWWDEPLPEDLPSSVSAAALFENDCLVTQLVCGDITGAQYRAAIASLAADDDERHPVVLPPGRRL